MPDKLEIFLFVIAAYFLCAAFIPRIRLRWSIRKSQSLFISRAGVQRSRQTKRGLYLGFITCVGLAVLIAGFALVFYMQRAPFEYVVFAGFGLVFIGWITDLFFLQKVANNISRVS